MSNTDAKVRERRAAAEKLKKRNQRRQKNNVNVYFWKKFAGIAVAVVCALLVLALIVPNLTVTHLLTPAMKVGNVTVSATEFSYSYQNQFSSYWQELYYRYYYYYYYMTGSTPSSDTISGMMPIDLYKSLKNQNYNDDATYAEFFRDAAIENLSNLYALYQDAVKNGQTLSDEDYASIDEEIASLKESAEENNYASFDRYLSVNLGKGITEKNLRSYMEKYTLASNWAEKVKDGFEYSDADVDAYYNGKDDEGNSRAEGYDIMSVRYITFAATYSTDEDKAVSNANAKAKAEAFMSGITTDAEFSAKALAKAQDEAVAAGKEASSVTSESTLHADIKANSLDSVNADLGAWAKSAERKVGDITLIEYTSTEDKVTYYVAFMSATRHKDTARNVDADHLLIQIEDATDEKEVALAKNTLENIKKILEASATDGVVSREAFLEQVNGFKESGDNAKNDLIKVEELGEFSEGDMVAAFNDWCFDESRKEGDLGIIQTSYGYHLVRFNADCGITWQTEVDDDMRSEDYTAYQEARKVEYPTTTYWLGTDFLREEPLPY